MTPDPPAQVARVEVPDPAGLDREASPSFPPATPISYATAPSADEYRAIMRLFYENRQSYGTHLTVSDVVDRIAERHGERRSSTSVEADLEQLRRWGALDARQDNPRARTASELVRNQRIYDITAAGEECERFLDALGSLRERAGSLQGQRLTAILRELLAIAGELDRHEPRAEAVQASFTQIIAALGELSEGAKDFMRDIDRLARSTEQLQPDAFQAYKQQVLDHLTGFRVQMDDVGQQIPQAIAQVESRGVDRMLELVARGQNAPIYGLSTEESQARTVETLSRGWLGVLAWFGGVDGGAPKFALLDIKLQDAIGWILRAVNRLRERDSRRVDRSTEFRHLAGLFHTASSDDEAHALYHAAFGLTGARHFTALNRDDEVHPAQASWWDTPAVPIEARLRNPNRKSTGIGRSASVRDNAAAREALRRRRDAERAQLDGALARFDGEQSVRLSDLAELDTDAFRHLLSWIGRALERGRSGGVRRAESADGLVMIELGDAPLGAGSVDVVTETGVLRSPDFALRVVRQ